MNYFDKLEKEYIGIDCNVKISLFEYNLIWKIGENEIRFIYKINDNKFDSSDIDKNIDIYKEYDWIDWQNIYSYLGTNKIEFDLMDLTLKINVLLNYYGHENIFGSCYYPLTFKDILRYRIDFK